MAEEEGRKAGRRRGRGGRGRGGEGAGPEKSRRRLGAIQSKPNQSFKPYLRCLTSGEPDLGKGKERKKERRKKRRKKERKGERNKENTSHQNQPERGEKKACAATI